MFLKPLAHAPVRKAPEAERTHEALVCPSCMEAFEFGNVCPDCDVSLLGESLFSQDADADNSEVAHIAQKRTLEMALGILGMSVVSLVFDPFGVFTFMAVLAPVGISHRLLSLPKPVRRHLALSWLIGSMAVCLAATGIQLVKFGVL